ncbi:MAG: hypothetical protein M3391_04285 [Actinomycetota bacterium]|nr:hypothetical protein [Actinomycetota bacterium]
MLFAHTEPAGGAPLEDLIPASIVAIIALVILGALGVAHRSGRLELLPRLAGVAERTTGVPGWASLPASLTGLSLLVAVFGFYWDVAMHIDNGRDPGPFANPAHFFIIFGLAGIALGGYLALLLGAPAAMKTAIRIRNGWHAPLGAILLMVCGIIALFGFPLDDVWHRIFGQDVTLWGPTHLQMIGGASLSTLSLWVLVVEARTSDEGKSLPAPRWKLATIGVNETVYAGAFLVGLSTVQGEFDYSVPQFRLLFHPVLLMLAAGAGLVAARIRLGRGGALKAALVFLVLRGLLSLLVGPVFGRTTLHMPLYLVEAALVELVALKWDTGRQLSFGALCGAAIGTIGLAAEWAWSHVWMTIPWPAELLPEGVLFGVAAGITGGLIGGFIGRALSPDRPQQRASGWLAAATAGAVLFVLAYPLPISSDLDASARVSLEESRTGRVHATVEPQPAGALEDVEWLNVTSWQGGGSIVIGLERAADGTYRTEDPVPVTGDWKTLIRLHQGSSIMALPIYLPEDQAVGAPEVPARSRFERDFVLDKKLLLREAKTTDAWLSYVAYSVLGAIVLTWVGVLGWGLRRLRTSGSARSRRPRARGQVVAPAS